MSLSTLIEGLSVQELLRIIGNSRLSCVLTILDHYRSGRIVFTWGRVVHSSASGQERLGEVLVREGLLTEQDLEFALDMQKDHLKPRPLGTLVSRLGLVDTDRIKTVLLDQMRSAFFELLTWTRGTVHLQVDTTTDLSSVMLDVSLDTSALLLEWARQEDEHGRTNGELADTGVLAFSPGDFGEADLAEEGSSEMRSGVSASVPDPGAPSAGTGEEDSAETAPAPTREEIPTDDSAEHDGEPFSSIPS